MEFTKINNDVNGNPRYVVHFFELLNGLEGIQHMPGASFSDKISEQYKLAVKKARKIGGKKFHNKQFGGGICFQSYNLAELEKSIIEIRG